MIIGSTPLGGCIGLFLKNSFSNFRSHIRDSKWGRKCIFINCTSSNKSPQEIPFQSANRKMPHSRCRAFWVKKARLVYQRLPKIFYEFCQLGMESDLLLTKKSAFWSRVLQAGQKLVASDKQCSRSSINEHQSQLRDNTIEQFECTV